MPKKWSANTAAQPVFNAMNDAIRGLLDSAAIEVQEEVSSHAEAMIEGIKEDERGKEDYEEA